MIKKTLLIFPIVLFSLLFLFGCNKDNDIVLTVKDYFPIRENVHYMYEGYGNEYASYDIYIDYASEDRVQQRVNNGGTEVCEVIEIKDGKMTMVFSGGEIYYRENFLDKTEKEDILLMEPLTVGTTWELDNSRVSTITNVEVNIETPAGNYQAIEVTTEGPDYNTVDYYAKDVGLVKSVFIVGQDEITSTLSKIEENVPFVQQVNFYYPNIDDEKYYYVTKDVTFMTNDITREILAAEYKEVLSGNMAKVFSANTQINSLYLGQDGIVYIDLNKAFVTDMNAGSMFEQMILQSVANTFGAYYNAQKVILTIEGQLYESGHIMFKKGQALDVKIDDAIPSS